MRCCLAKGLERISQAIWMSVTIFQSYQDDRRMIMIGCANWNPNCLQLDRCTPQAGLEPRTA